MRGVGGKGGADTSPCPVSWERREADSFCPSWRSAVIHRAAFLPVYLSPMMMIVVMTTTTMMMVVVMMMMMVVMTTTMMMMMLVVVVVVMLLLDYVCSKDYSWRWARYTQQASGGWDWTTGPQNESGRGQMEPELLLLPSCTYYHW